MLPLMTALFTAAMALVAKMFFDSAARFRERQGLAASLAGEMEAYLTLAPPAVMVSALRLMADLPRDKRLPTLQCFSKLPQNHPVFDLVADKIGTLSVHMAREISKVYNVMTGLRLVLMELPSQRFTDLGEELQVPLLQTFATTVEQELASAPKLIDDLKRMSSQGYCSYAFSWIFVLLQRITSRVVLVGAELRQSLRANGKKKDAII